MQFSVACYIKQKNLNMIQLTKNMKNITGHSQYRFEIVRAICRYYDLYAHRLSSLEFRRSGETQATVSIKNKVGPNFLELLVFWFLLNSFFDIPKQRIFINNRVSIYLSHTNI